MATREEIREGIRQIEIEWYGEPPDGTVATPHRTFVAHLLDYLHSQGVVIKVERELPGYLGCDCESCTAWREASVKAQEDMVEAGYVAVERLIEEVTDGR